MKRVHGRSSFLTGLVMFSIFVAALLYGGQALATGGADHASGKAIAIVAPAENEIIQGGTVDVIIELRDKGVSGDHVHLYLDGKLVKPLHGRRITHTLTGLSSGSHNIVIKLATKRHKILETEDSVNIEVK
ncbi:MAG: Ig-like domain-containing protein [Thermodesulfobacteriota bacterium]